MKDIIENVFFITDQFRLKQWQEDRLYHSILLSSFNDKIYSLSNELMKVLMSEKKIRISDSLFTIENDADVSKLLIKFRDFLDELKTDKIGWGGGVQTIVDNLHKEVELFSHSYIKEE